VIDHFRASPGRVALIMGAPPPARNAQTGARQPGTEKPATLLNLA
jgi:hypothetical protein